MRLIDLGPRTGKLPDAMADPLGWVVVYQDEADGHLRFVQLHPDGTRRVPDVPIAAFAGNAFPVLDVYRGEFDTHAPETWLAFRDGVNNHGVLMNITTGARHDLGLVHGNCPIILGDGYCMWQGSDDYGIWYRWLDGDFSKPADRYDRTPEERGAPTGLAWVTYYDGPHPILVDAARLLEPGMVNPRYAGHPVECVVGENADAGPDRNLARLEGSGRECVLWTGTASFTPRIAYDGQRWAVVTYGGPGVRLALLEDADFVVPAPTPEPPQPDPDRWTLVPDGTLVTDAFTAMFGAAPPTSADGRRLYFAKNAPPQGEWREVGGDICYHLFDQSRGEDVPTGPRTGWYLYAPDDVPVWALNAFHSGDAVTFKGEKIEFDNGARVPWTHRNTLYGLKAGGVCVQFDPRFPNQDYGPEKCYERQFTRLDGGIRWELWYSPEAARSLPWGDRSLDVLKQAVEDQAVPGAPQPAYIECPRLSVDSDPWAVTEPPPEPDMPYTPVSTSDAELTELAARLDLKYRAPADQGGLGRGPTETHVDPLGHSRWRRDYFYYRDTGSAPEAAWRAVNQAINDIVGLPGDIDPNTPGQPPVTGGTLQGPITVNQRDFEVPGL